MLFHCLQILSLARIDYQLIGTVNIFQILFLQGKIYVTGGFGASKAILSSQECYDPEQDKWTKMPAMKKMCGFVGGVLVDRPVHFQDRPISNSTTATTS